MNKTQLLIEAVEKDDLDTFKQYFILDNWKDTVLSIANYSGVINHNNSVTQDDCDIFKYSLHCNADKIFSYLLPLVDTHKHGDNYGWPLLSMALKNNRYDYAYMIINHKTFNPYPRYHTNNFSFIEKKDNPQQHIDFLFHYLDKFDQWDFEDYHLIYVFSHLICYNETTYHRFNQVYQTKLNNSEVFVLDMFKDNLSTLGKEIFKHYFRAFILDKLTDKQLHDIVSSIINDDIMFIAVFESEDAKTCLHYLLKTPDLLQQHINNNQMIVSYLPLDCILLLIDNDIDIWIENEKHICPIDYILDDSNLENPATLYFMNSYTQKIFDRLEKNNNKNNIYKYCHHKLLKHRLPIKNVKSTYSKI